MTAAPSPRPDGGQRLALVGAGAATLLSVAGLLGWVTPWRWLASLNPASIPIAPSTALALVFLGAAVLLAARRGPPRLALALAALVTVFVCAQLVIIQAGLSPALDTLLVPTPHPFESVFAGRMSPWTALGLLCSSLSLLSIGLARGRRALGSAGGGLALFVCLAGGVITLGYLFDSPLLSGGAVVPVAFPAAVALCCLGVALLALTPRDSALLRPLVGPSVRARLLRALLPIAPAVLVFEGLLDRIQGLNPALDSAMTALASAIVLAAGVSYAAIGVSRDLERARAREAEAERKRLASAQEYRSLFDSNPHPMWVFDAETLAFLAVNDAAVRLYGFSRDEFLGMTIRDIRPPEEVPALLEYLTRMPDSPSLPATQVKHHRKDGSLIEVEGSSNPIEFHGRRARLVLADDISERRRLEAELLQARKMEAVGRLAGGVAHDFNNLLGVILGYTELLLPDMTQTQRGMLEQVIKAAHRASDLTRQLLAFSRNQIVDPKVLDLNALLANMEKTLRQLVGKEVDLTIVRGADLGQVKADSGQIERVVLNLCLNSRDAMPGGGRLRIETANTELHTGQVLRDEPVAAGRYVTLTVSDTGSGMEKELLDHIFEPFFTTKEQGKGTGLGLAMVYGIVKQADGHVRVSSQSGLGTTFSVFLPRVDGPAGATAVQETSPPSPGWETILLVEDENSLRALAARVLSSQGYRVIAAGDAREALEIAGRHLGPIHLLVTDVVMPGMNGRLLAEALVAARPELEVLYMSGYTDDVIAFRGVLDAGTRLLEKPFTVAELLARVRSTLDERSHKEGN